MFTTRILRRRPLPERRLSTSRGAFLHPHEAGKVLGLKGESHIKERVIRHITLWLGRAPRLQPKRYPLRKLLTYISEEDCASAATQKADAAARLPEDQLFLENAAAAAKTDKQGFREIVRHKNIDLKKELRLDRHGRACRRVIVPSAVLSEIKKETPTAPRGARTLIELAAKWGYDKGYIRTHAKALGIPLPLFPAKDAMGRWSPISHVLRDDQSRLKAALGHLPSCDAASATGNLNDTDWVCLDALFDFKAFTPAMKVAVSEIAGKKEMNVGTLGRTATKLKTLGLVGIMRGRAGGCWLTLTGKEAVEAERR